jgi:hypothetical protein
MADLSQAISKICSEYATSCIDLFNTSGFNEQTASTLSADNLHPNATGKVIVGNECAKAIKGGSAFGNMYPKNNEFEAPFKIKQGANSTATLFEIENLDSSLLTGEYLGQINFISNDSNVGNSIAGSIANILQDNGFWYGLELSARSSGTKKVGMLINHSGSINMPNLPTYADEAAALAAGLLTGDIYKTSTGELRIKL